MYNLTDEQRKKLVEIVGEENISTEPWQRDAYGIWFASQPRPDGEGVYWTERAAAIITPRTVEQVQKITQYCNETDLMIHVTSTGQLVAGAATFDHTLLLDMSRMDDIVSMDGENMTVVVEPFARSIDVQMQSWKKNCNPYVISIGAVGSTLAAATSHTGYGSIGTSCGYGPRTLLGVEWVMPDGDVIRFGSAGQGSGWFTAAGPGPDLLGSIRGFNGAMGGLGAYTKAAIKMGPWYGPSEIGGDEIAFGCKTPSNFIKKGGLPKNMSLNTTIYPSMEAMSDAHYHMHEENICYSGSRMPAFVLAMAPLKDNASLVKEWESGFHKKIYGYTLSNQIQGASQDEYEWKQKCFNKVVSDAGGIRMRGVLKMYPKIAEDIMKLFHAGLSPDEYRTLQLDIQARIDALPVTPIDIMAAGASTAAALRNVDPGLARPASAMFTLGGNLDTWDAGVVQNKLTMEIKEPYVTKGGILDDGVDTGCGNPYEGGHLGYTENVFWVNRVNKNGAETLPKAIGDAVTEIQKGISSFTISSGMNNERFGPYEFDYQIWTKRIKKILDPNDACDSTTYSGSPDHKEVPMNG
ncbi:FAD-dependent oxidoreductase [Christensenellaceae bacterium OttesenSCG-928-K19]|nr:FAD-dependent oxidoreductase [Christensenellaceae bacterium OttesenSCG-928-K19]